MRAQYQKGSMELNELERLALSKINTLKINGNGYIAWYNVWCLCRAWNATKYTVFGGVRDMAHNSLNPKARRDIYSGVLELLD